MVTNSHDTLCKNSQEVLETILTPSTSGTRIEGPLDGNLQSLVKDILIIIKN